MVLYIQPISVTIYLVQKILFHFLPNVTQTGSERESLIWNNKKAEGKSSQRSCEDLTNVLTPPQFIANQNSCYMRKIISSGADLLKHVNLLT